MPMETARGLARFKAAIFDLDGTLVHSEHAWEAAKVDVLARYGLTPSQTLLDAFVGRGLAGFVDAAFDRPLPPDERRSICDQIGAVADDLLPVMRHPVAGACELLRNLQAEGMRIAICSSSPRRHISSALEMLDLEACVETVISGSELPRGKPDPLPYSTALVALDLEPHMACAFEDSLPGAQSAHGAGLSVFAIGAGCTGSEFNFCQKRAESFGDFFRGA